MVVIVILDSCKKVKHDHMGDEPYTHVYGLYPFDEAVYIGTSGQVRIWTLTFATYLVSKQSPSHAISKATLRIWNGR